MLRIYVFYVYFYNCVIIGKDMLVDQAVLGSVGRNMHNLEDETLECRKDSVRGKTIHSIHQVFTAVLNNH